MQEIPAAFPRCRPISKAPSRASRTIRRRPISGPNFSPKAMSSTISSTMSPRATTRHKANCRLSSPRSRTIKNSARRSITARAAFSARALTMNCSAARSTPILRTLCTGLQGILNGDTGDALAAEQAQIQAAGTGFVADANDVSGNNIPLGGGSYVGDATTVAGATSVPGVAQGTIPVAGTAAGTPGSVAQGGGAGGSSGQAGGGGQPAGGHGAQGAEGQSGQGAGDNGHGGQGDPCHGGGCNSGEHGNHGAPVPSFAQFAENEQSPFGF